MIRKQTYSFDDRWMPVFQLMKHIQADNPERNRNRLRVISNRSVNGTEFKQMKTNNNIKGNSIMKLSAFKNIKIPIVAFLILLTFSQISRATDLKNKVPKSSFYVLTINGANLFDKVSMADFKNTPMFKSFHKEISGKKEIPDIEQWGVQWESSSYMFFELTESVTYIGYLIPLRNANQFNSFVSDHNDKIITDQSGTSKIRQGKTLLAWNNEFIVLLMAHYMGGYANDQINDGIRLDQKMTQIFNLKPSASISSNKDFMSSQDATADAVFWMSSKYGGFYEYFSKWTTMGMGSRIEPSSLASFYDGNYISSKLFFNKSDITLEINSNLNKNWSKLYKKISDAKINQAFFNYLSSDNLIGYYSFAFSTQAVLEEMPEILKPLYASMPMYGDVAGNSMDLLSLVIDEEAIGNLIKGDGLMAITNISKEKVTYTGYEYDENFKRTEVEKTKDEFIPEFLAMMSTADVKSVQKIFNLMESSKSITKVDNYYKVSLPKSSPIDLYLIRKNNIIFFCNTESMLNNILTGKSSGSLSSEHKNMINASSICGYVDGVKVLEGLSEEFREIDQKNEWFHYVKKNVRQVYWTQKKPKKGAIKSEMKLITPDDNKNSLAFLLSFSNKLFEMVK